MKTLTSLLFILSIVMIHGQSVSTLTPEFKGSGGLSLDNDGNLYIGDFGDFLSTGDGDGVPNKVMVLDTDLNLLDYSTGFIGASGNDFDSNGILHQSDIGASGIYKIIDGERILVTNNGISNPVGIAFDSEDNFYVCNCGNNTIRKVTPDLTSTLFASGSVFACPNGITVDEDDNLYVSNFSNGNIIKITSDGSTEVLIASEGGSTSGPSNGHLDYHEATRTLFIASHGSNKIYSLDIDDPSELFVVAGSGVRGNTDGDAETATFSRPNGVAVTQSGDSIYINSAIPLTNTPSNPLNPQVIRLITGVQSTVSVETLTIPASNVTLYPNPMDDHFRIEADLSMDYTDLALELFDMEGRSILKETGLGTTSGHLIHLLDTRQIAGGMYSFRLTADDVIILSGKALKN